MAKYAHLFNYPERAANGAIDHQFLFCSNLGKGATGAAQLVLHVPSNTPCVRKTLTPRLSAEEMDDDMNTSEMRVLEYLRSQPENDPPLYINGMWCGEDIYPSDDAGARPFRALYLEHCNGGDLNQLYESVESSRIGMAPGLILRIVKQMTTALNYLYTRAQPILHRDIGMANIFCHWTSAGRVDFYLGDFGFALMGAVDNGRSDIWSLKGVVRRLSQLLPEQLGPGTAQDGLLAQICAEINALGEDDLRPANQLPDLTNLMILVGQIPDDEEEDEEGEEEEDDAAAGPWRAYNFNDAHLQLAARPCYYETREECLQPHVRGTAVHGPWHVARVSPNGAAQTPPVAAGAMIVDWESTWEHRPFDQSADPVSENEDVEW